MERHMLRLTYRDFAALVPQKTDVVLLPVGTMEAHGCTNLGTDVTIPEYICERLAERLNAIIAPTIPYGITRTLLPYPGSLTVSPQSFEGYVTDVLVSLFRAGFGRAVVVNGHGGHYEPLRNAAKTAWELTGGKSVVIHWWELCGELTKRFFGEAGGHAALDETAMVLAADPNLVKQKQCEEISPFLVRQGSYVYPNPAPLLLYRAGEGTPRFDRELAQRYADAVVEHIAQFVEEVFRGWEKHLPPQKSV